MITLEELKTKIDKNARLIGLDLGKKRIGVSICDHKRIIATPFKTIEYVDHENFITELKEIINQENIDGTSTQSKEIYVTKIDEENETKPLVIEIVNDRKTVIEVGEDVGDVLLHRAREAWRRCTCFRRGHQALRIFGRR